MAQPRHSDTEYQRGHATDRLSGESGYSAGGQIADMQANIARRLANDRIDAGQALAEPAAERAVRRMSKAAGYGSLLAGYGLVVLAFVRWM